MKIIPLLLLALALPASARLGETAEQCTARYGNPEKDDGLEAAHGAILRKYQKGNVLISIEFLAGKAERITFTQAAIRPFTREAVLALLEANKGASPWAESKAPMMTVAAWTSKDRSAFWTLTPFLVIQSETWNAMDAEAQKQKEATDLEGF